MPSASQSNQIINIGKFEFQVHVNAALTDENVIIMYSNEFKRAMAQHILNEGYLVNTMPTGWDEEKIRQHVHVIRVKESPE